MTVGEKIRSKRRAAGLSRKELADRAGCSPRSISYWERGERRPRLPQLLSVTEALDIGLMEFIKEVEL